MALTEARAAWQRTANRCLVQEDAKRAPKFACGSSIPPIAKQLDSEPTTIPGGVDIPTSGSEPVDGAPSYSNLSPNSRWWLHLQPHYGYHKYLIDEQLNMDTYIDNFKSNENEIVGEVTDKVCYEVRKNANELYFGAEKNIPWWRTADTEELVLLVSQRSDEFIENCDLPSPTPRNNTTHVKNCNNMRRFGHDKIFDSKLRLAAEGELASAVDKRMSSTPEKIQTFENDPSKAELLKALQHSQTRAREAEKVAKQAYAEKEHVVKIVFRQASQIFAYKQWLQLLQLENKYSQGKHNVPIMLPWTPQKTRKMRKSLQKPTGRKRAKRARSRYDVGKYAIVFALGLGLVGAGLLLGWTIGWMLC